MKAETRSCEECEHVRIDYQLIIDISKSGDTIPQISLQKTEELLRALKPNVCDHFNVSALHYINGGLLAIGKARGGEKIRSQ